jgi:hypothetical protein
MSKKARMTDAADASVKAMNKVKAAVGAVGRALSRTSRPPGPSSSPPASSSSSPPPSSIPPEPPDPNAEKQSDTASVLFEALACTEYGEAVCVIGDHAHLGAWDPARAVALDPSAYPTWSGRVEFQHGQRIEYKYLRRRSDGSVAWEARPGNRELVVPVSGPEVIARDQVD